MIRFGLTEDAHYNRLLLYKKGHIQHGVGVSLSRTIMTFLDRIDVGETNQLNGSSDLIDQQSLECPREVAELDVQAIVRVCCSLLQVRHH